MGDRARGRLFGRGRFFGVVPMIRMTTFKSIVAAGVIAAATLSATGANALFLSGTFDITAYNYNPTGTNTEKRNRSQASKSNFDAISAVNPSIGTSVLFDTFEYTGALDFRVGRDFNPDGNGITTIAEFLGTGSGAVTTGTGIADRDFDLTFGGRTNSAGQGNGDGGAGGQFVTTTLYKITARSLNISDLSRLDFVNA